MNFSFRKRLFESPEAQQRDVRYNYEFEGCKIGKGTYGHVYKASSRTKNEGKFYALKLIDVAGLTVSACREISVLRELDNENIIKLEQVFLSYKEKNVWLVLEYAEYDLWHMIKFRKECFKEKRELKLPPAFVKSIMFQLLSGINYLHKNWIMHRDLKPANILVMGKGSQTGVLKITDMGFARVFYDPLKPLADVDTVVVTLWYRSAELLLGTRHYTTAIDNWAIGCIFSELVTLEPLFYCRQDELKNNSPYNIDQLDKIFSVLGCPNEKDWTTLKSMPEYTKFLKDFNKNKYANCSLNKYFEKYANLWNTKSLDLLSKLLMYDPIKRFTASKSLANQWFKDTPLPSRNIFETEEMIFPLREFLKE